MEYTEQTTLSKYVKAMRKQYNLTQVELSEKSGVGFALVREFGARQTDAAVGQGKPATVFVRQRSWRSTYN